MNCPNCLKTIDITGMPPSFCPWCGTKLDLSGDADLNELLRRAENESDYVRKHDLLLEAAKRYPNHPEIEKRLLYIGRLWERGGKPDFYRIPYWPLNALERPGEFSRRERLKMLERFFRNPEVERVAALQGDREAFYSEYYTKMAVEYIELFIKKTQSNNNIFFFKRSEKSRLERYAQCVRTMLANLGVSQAVPLECKPVMEQALIKGFRQVFSQELPRE